MHFHNTIRPILIIFLLFGQFPLYGVVNHKPLRWHVRWCSPQTLLSFVLMHVGLFLCFVEFDRLKEIGVNADNILGPLFYLDVILIMLLLLRVAYRWPTVVPKWDHIESLEVMQYNARQQDTRSSRRIRSIALLLLLLGFAEHMLSIGKTVNARVDEAQTCNWDYSNLAEYYAKRTYGFFYQRVPYNFLSFIFLEYANTALTMVWTVQDVWIIMISHSIAGFFQRINAKIQFFTTVQIVAREKFWSEIHSDYVMVCELLEHVMSICSPLLVVSCGTNLYLICYQLFHLVARSEGFIIVTVFTYFSLLFLIMRTFLTMHYCSSVHEVARKPLKLLRRIPTSDWCDELERFYSFIRRNPIAFNAMGLFRLTKRTMLTMLGAVITYELVMLHFAQSTANEGIVRECSTKEFYFEPKMQSQAN